MNWRTNGQEKLDLAFFFSFLYGGIRWHLLHKFMYNLDIEVQSVFQWLSFFDELPLEFSEEVWVSATLYTNFLDKTTLNND